MTDSEMMRNEISLSDIRISTDKNPWKFSNFSYRKFFKFYKFHFPLMQFFICTITMRFIHCWETAFWNTQWCSSPFAFLFKNLLHVSNSVILLNVWLKKTKNHFFLFSFSKQIFVKFDMNSTSFRELDKKGINSGRYFYYATLFAKTFVSVWMISIIFLSLYFSLL